MKASNVPAFLRELADRFEAAGFDPDASVKVDLGCDTVTSRPELAKWVEFCGTPLEVKTAESTSWLSRYAWSSSSDTFGVSVHFTPGLLGGKVIEVNRDDDAGLAKLMAEAKATESEATHA